MKTFIAILLLVFGLFALFGGAWWFALICAGGAVWLFASGDVDSASTSLSRLPSAAPPALPARRTGSQITHQAMHSGTSAFASSDDLTRLWQRVQALEKMLAESEGDISQAGLPEPHITRDVRSLRNALSQLQKEQQRLHQRLNALEQGPSDAQLDLPLDAEPEPVTARGPAVDELTRLLDRS